MNVYAYSGHNCPVVQYDFNVHQLWLEEEEDQEEADEIENLLEKQRQIEEEYKTHKNPNIDH